MTYDDVRRLGRLPPVERYRAANQAIEAHRQAMAEAAKVRAQALKELQKAGANMTELAKLFGVSRQSLYQAMSGRV